MIHDTSEEFINRHIGPSKEDQLKMLDYIGNNSLKELIKDTVPENILLKKELNMAHSLSESECAIFNSFFSNIFSGTVSFINCFKELLPI